MRLITLLGTRPELIRLSVFIKEADQYFEHILIHSGQNFSHNLNDIFFDEMKIRKPDYFLNVSGSNLGETIGNIIDRSYNLFVKIKPDCLFILGDTNSSLCSISAKRLKIPVFHVEAGNRCFDENVPEEINRRIIDHISDINMCYTENARRNLLNEGLKNGNIFVVGSPMPEVIKHYYPKILESNILNKLNLEKNKFFVFSMHREENIDHDKHLDQIVYALSMICDKYQLPIIFSVHPRTHLKLDRKNITLHSLIKRMPAMGFFDYCQLQINAFCVLSDSGSLSEEAAMLNFPAVSIRESTERQEALDKGNIVLGNLTSDRILESIHLAVNTHNSDNIIKPNDYLDDNVSIKMIKIIQSYTNIINKTVWFK
jgi:UDP-N-acetyl-L-fucosamine synthase